MNGPDEITRESDAEVFPAAVRSSVMPGPPAAVELHIEELVLRGFAAGDRFRIAAAVESELARLIARGGLPGLAEGPAPIERLDAGAFPLTPGDGPARVGFEVARKVYARLSPAAPESSDARSRTNRIPQ